MPIFGGKSPSVFYVYGNIKYRAEIENEINKITDTFFDVPQSKYNLCGFKIVSYSLNDISKLDISLSKYEGWIQTEKRRDYEEIDVGYTNFDKFTTGCNYRYYFKDSTDINVYSKLFKSYLGIKQISIINDNATYGTYEIDLDDNDKVTGIVNALSTYENNNIYVKNLFGKSLIMSTSNCDLINLSVEINNKLEKNFTLEGRESEPGIENIRDFDLSTYVEYSFTNNPEFLIPDKIIEKVLFSFALNIDATMGLSYGIYYSDNTYSGLISLGSYTSNSTFPKKNIVITTQNKPIKKIFFWFALHGGTIRIYDFTYT
ncbi:MAG: hypothetical protein PHP18_05695 [Bacilli bacterium]|nr:hypothetical protein [Bacilli bacterium]